VTEPPKQPQKTQQKNGDAGRLVDGHVFVEQPTAKIADDGEANEPVQRNGNGRIAGPGGFGHSWLLDATAGCLGWRPLSTHLALAVFSRGRGIAKADRNICENDM
jgi:hypothetical protein